MILNFSAVSSDAGGLPGPEDAGGAKPGDDGAGREFAGAAGPALSELEREKLKRLLLQNSQDLRRSNQQKAQLESFAENGYGKHKLPYWAHHLFLTVYTILGTGIGLGAVGSMILNSSISGTPSGNNLFFAAGAAGGLLGWKLANHMLKGMLGIRYERATVHFWSRRTGKPLPDVQEVIEFLDHHPRLKGGDEVREMIADRLGVRRQEEQVLRSKEREIMESLEEGEPVSARQD